MISGFVTGDAAVVARFERIPLALREQLRVAVTRLAIKLQRKVKADKLSGQVLKVKTGTLRRSIDQSVMQTEHGVTGKVSTNVSYGKKHEYGFHGTETVPAQLRTIKQAFGRSITPVEVMVKSYEKRVDLPERSFLRSALREMNESGEIRHEIEAAVARVKK